MFCMNCGKQLPDGAKFCKYCGTSQEADTPVESVSNVININQSTKLVPGTCTNCGASLQVDPSQQAAICPACGTPYIVQQAINNFNIHSTGNISIENAVIAVPGANAENYLKRAIGYEQQFDLEKALEYYNKALDADASNQDAMTSVARINMILNDYVYKSGIAVSGLFSSGKLVLKKNRLLYITNKGKETRYELSLMTNIKGNKNILEFVYDGISDRPVSFGAEANEWVSVLNSAKTGNYPQITMETLIKQPNYTNYSQSFNEFLSKKGFVDSNVNISGSYNVMLTNANDSMMVIIKTYKDYKHCSLMEAKEFVENLPGVILSTSSKTEADKVASMFTAVGATIEIK